MAPTIWVAQLHVSNRTAEKLRSVHQLEPEEVRQEVVCVAGLTYTENIHPIYGWRALLFITIRSQKVLVVLFPTKAADVWNLGSAYRV